MNRLSMENRTEPITKDLDFLLQDPFLLYRNARSSICGIWFYDTEECQRIAELMKNLTQYEQLKAHHGAGAGTPPMTLSSREEKEVDIVRMLARAKDEYTKCKTARERQGWYGTAGANGGFEKAPSRRMPELVFKGKTKRGLQGVTADQKRQRRGKV
nr:mRNA-decapping enzyme 1B isoform X1 [Vicugna pacos]